MLLVSCPNFTWNSYFVNIHFITGITTTPKVFINVHCDASIYFKPKV
jgi:hypothetical protein